MKLTRIEKEVLKYIDSNVNIDIGGFIDSDRKSTDLVRVTYYTGVGLPKVLKIDELTSKNNSVYLVNNKLIAVTEDELVLYISKWIVSETV